jgi:hypothetical protein
MRNSLSSYLLMLSKLQPMMYNTADQGSGLSVWLGEKSVCLMSGPSVAKLNVENKLIHECPSF